MTESTPIPHFFKGLQIIGHSINNVISKYYIIKLCPNKEFISLDIERLIIVVYDTDSWRIDPVLKNHSVSL